MYNKTTNVCGKIDKRYKIMTKIGGYKVSTDQLGIM